MLQLIGEPELQSLVNPNHVVVAPVKFTVMLLDVDNAGMAQAAFDVKRQVITSPFNKLVAL